MSFSVNVAKLASKRKAEIGDIKRAIVFDVFKNVIKKTPVDSGRAKGNWFVSENAPSAEMNSRKDRSQLGGIGASSTRELDLVNARFTIDILTNNLPYASLLEFGGYNHATDKTTASGYSSQAPFGMVRQTLREFSRIAKKQGWK